LTIGVAHSAFNSQDIQSNMKPFLISLLLILAVLTPAHGEARALSGKELDRIGRRIWQNECAGTVNGLTSWNSGENFASLGIGHFIWYPAGVEGPFEESFPKLVAWLGRSGVRLPAWLPAMKDCPWPDRQTFLRDHDGSRQKDLRALLAATVRQQTEFIIARLADATPKFHAAAGRLGQRVEENIALLQQTGAGNFAMIDYVNFKGEGLNPKERYKGEGWGLLQVLMGMQAADAASAPGAFADSAKRVLARRVQNSPPERGEKRWLSGWQSRCEAYRN
jgi:hypothetical protein